MHRVYKQNLSIVVYTVEYFMFGGVFVEDGGRLQQVQQPLSQPRARG